MREEWEGEREGRRERGERELLYANGLCEAMHRGTRAQPQPPSPQRRRRARWCGLRGAMTDSLTTRQRSQRPKRRHRAREGGKEGKEGGLVVLSAFCRFNLKFEGSDKEYDDNEICERERVASVCTRCV